MTACYRIVSISWQAYAKYSQLTSRGSGRWSIQVFARYTIVLDSDNHMTIKKRIAAAFAMQFLAVRCRCGVFIASKWGQWKAIKHTNVNCTTEIFSAHKQSMQASNRTIYLPYFIVILANQAIRIGRRRVWSVASRIFKQQTNISLEQLNSVCALANNCAECTQFGMTIVRTHHREKNTLTTNWATGEQANKKNRFF